LGSVTKDNESQGLPAVHDNANQTLQNAPEGVEGTVEVNEPEASVVEVPGKGHHEAIVVEGVQQGYRWVEDE
jgi:hypothetical protein